MGADALDGVLPGEEKKMDCVRDPDAVGMLIVPPGPPVTVPPVGTVANVAVARPLSAETVKEATGSPTWSHWSSSSRTGVL